jgi:hypothetical protein
MQDTDDRDSVACLSEIDEMLLDTPAAITKPAKPPPMAGRKQEVLQPRE